MNDNITDIDILTILKYATCIDPSLEKRFIKCEEYYKFFFEKQRFNKASPQMCFFDADVSAWYFYHLKLYVFDPYNCDMNLCARIVPIFKTIGIHLNKLIQISGFELRFKKILKEKTRAIDNLICEIVTILIYQLKISDNVSFIKERPPVKSSDILVKFKNIDYHVEVKRKIKNYKYHNDEREQWNYLSKPVREYLRSLGKNICFEIVFHNELCEYSENYLLEKIVDIINQPIGFSYEDENILISKRKVNIDKTQDYLKNNYLRTDTTQVLNMLFDYDFEKDIAISYGTQSLCKMTPLYYDDIEWAFALIWKCDSGKAIDNHAISIKKLLVKAVEQIPKSSPSALHFVIESYQGNEVDNKIIQKTKELISSFDFKNKNLHYIYLHFWKFRIPHNENWLVDQDCLIWESKDADMDFKISEPYLLNPSL